MKFCFTVISVLIFHVNCLDFIALVSTLVFTHKYGKHFIG